MSAIFFRVELGTFPRIKKKRVARPCQCVPTHGLWFSIRNATPRLIDGNGVHHGHLLKLVSDVRGQI